MKFGKDGIMNKIEVLKKIRAISEKDEDFIAITTGFVEFNELMENTEIGLEQVSKFFEKDPSLASLILKVANSSLYGLTGKVGTVAQAISLLGLKSIKNLYTTKILKKAIVSDEIKIFDGIWKHSLATAIASLRVIVISQPKLAENAFTSGLLHDFGKFVILKFFQEEYSQIKDILSVDPKKRLLVAEKEVLGLTHQEIGAFFARVWHLPDFVINSIRYHHYIGNTPEYKEYAISVLVGNNIVKGMELGESNNPFVAPIPSWIWSYLRITPKNIRQLIKEIQHQYNVMIAFVED